jgi:hypothetical protein
LECLRGIKYVVEQSKFDTPLLTNPTDQISISQSPTHKIQIQTQTQTQTQNIQATPKQTPQRVSQAILSSSNAEIKPNNEIYNENKVNNVNNLSNGKSFFISFRILFFLFGFGFFFIINIICSLFSFVISVSNNVVAADITTTNITNTIKVETPQNPNALSFAADVVVDPQWKQVLESGCMIFFSKTSFLFLFLFFLFFRLFYKNRFEINGIL